VAEIGLADTRIVGQGGLVEQQHLRLRRQRACDLQQALLRVGQLPGVVVRPAGEADNRQRLSRALLLISASLPETERTRQFLQRYAGDTAAGRR
jgi:hypothetical protein